MKYLIPALAALALATPPAFAGPPSTAALAPHGADSKFLSAAAAGGIAEVELGKLASEKGTDPDVKMFGQHMVADHTKVNEDLKKLADGKGITVPSTMDAKAKALDKRLSSLSGAAFDRTYVSEMLKDHKQDVAEFEKQSTAAKDPEVAAFASRNLPTLKEHLQRIEALSKKLHGAPAAKAAGM